MWPLATFVNLLLESAPAGAANLAGVRDDSSPRPTGRDEIISASLDAAERLYARNGLADVSLRDIAEEAGVTYSLLNRHLGTKEQIFESLLIRSEKRWRERVVGMGLAETLSELLGSDADAGAYLRMLASSLLASDGTAPQRHIEHSRMHELVPLAAATELPDGVDAATAAAAALALIFGWRLFNPYIVASLRLTDPAATEQLHAAMHRLLRGL